MAVPASRDATLLIFTDSEHNGLAFAEDGKVCRTLALPARGCEQVFWRTVDDLMQSPQGEKKDFSRVLVSSGPGSFTGIRLGMAVAEGMSFALNCERVAVDRFQQTVRLARTAECGVDRYVLVVLSSHLPHECFAQFFAPDGQACSQPFLLCQASWSDDLRKAIDLQLAPFDVLLCGDATHAVSAWFACAEAEVSSSFWKSLATYVVTGASLDLRAQALMDAALDRERKPTSQAALYVRPLAFVTAAQRAKRASMVGATS